MSPAGMTQPLKIAVDATPLFGQLTGVGGVTRAIVEGLATKPELEVTPLVVSWNARQQLADHATEVLPTADALHIVKFPARVAHRLWRFVNWPVVSGYDVVHGTNFVVPPANGAVELITIHDLTAWHMPELVSKYSLAYPKLVNRAVNRGAHIHTVSHAVTAEVLDSIEISPDRVHTISNGFDMPDPEPSPADLAAAADVGVELAGGPYVLCLGTIEPRKDHAGLLKAMKGVWAVMPNMKLVVAGADGWGTEAFEAAMQSNGLLGDERLVRLGYVSDRDRFWLLAGASCLAYPSLYEGFGLPPLEAMALGTPVVATNIAAVAEVCGDAAVLVPPGEPGLLAESLLSVLGGDRPELLETGRQQVRKYGWSTSVDQLTDLYQHLVNSKG